jgi:hypothetical protein
MSGKDFSNLITGAAATAGPPARVGRRRHGRAAGTSRAVIHSRAAGTGRAVIHSEFPPLSGG